MNQCTYAADVISMCMRDQHIDRLDARKSSLLSLGKASREKSIRTMSLSSTKYAQVLSSAKAEPFPKKFSTFLPPYFVKVKYFLPTDTDCTIIRGST